MTDGAGVAAPVQVEVGDCYRVLGSLGTGGNGEAFEARRTSDDLPIALIAAVVAKTRDWKTIKLFEREARVLASLSLITRRSLTFRESFVVESEAGTSLYLANRFLAPGRSPRAWIQLAGWHPDLTEVLRIAAFLLDVLTYLHTLNPPVVHRDIKPDNVIRGEDGRLWVVDFGAVRDFSTTMGGGSTVVGTYGYMAPEQFRGQAIPASDIYAVAATMLHLMTGRSPHELPQEKLKVVFRPMVQAPPSVLAWLDCALEPAPEDCFATPAAALDALRRGVVPPAANAKPLAAPSSRARLAILLGIVVVILGAATGVMINDVRESRQPKGAQPDPNAVLPNLPQRASSVYKPLRFVRALKGHMNRVMGVAVAPDGKILATGSEGSVKLWMPRPATSFAASRGTMARSKGSPSPKMASS